MASTISGTLPVNGRESARPPVSSQTDNLYANERDPFGPREVWNLLRRSWPFISEHRRMVRTKCVLAICSLTFFILTPWPVKIVIDNVIDGRPLSGIAARVLMPITGNDRAAILVAVLAFLVIAAFLVGMVGDEPQELTTGVSSGGLDQAGTTQNDANEGWSLWNGLFGYLETRVTLDLTQRINQSVRTAIYEKFLRSPLAVYTDQKIGDAVFRVMHDSASVGAVLYRGVLAPIMSIVMFLIALVVLSLQFADEPLIPEIAAILLPVVALGTTLFGKLLRNQSQVMRERGSDVMAAFEERLSQVQLIKAFGQERHETQSIDAASWNSFRAFLKLLIIIMLLGAVLAPAVGFLVYLAIYHLMLEVIHGKLTLGDIVLLTSYGAMLAQPMGVLGATWMAMQIPAAGLRRIHSVLDRLQESSVAVETGQNPTPITSIEFRDIALGYPDTPVLQDVSFQLRCGELTALAGPSGSGKTTLVLAIPRFLEPQKGSILINGVLANQVELCALRACVGFVFQQEALFSTTIAENIGYGSASASLEDIKRAAEKAGAAEFIDTLPDRYETMLGRRGARLSVGQKQRIAIARALLREPDILILDEPTAPLDTTSESGLIATLRVLARNHVVLIVAHRPSTLAACDRVLFLSRGTLSASGTHSQLITACAEYRAYVAVTGAELHA